MQNKIFTDQLGRTISINYPPQRIISLVPSQTELLFDLGLDEEVVGISKFCIHPAEQFQKKTKIGGTKTLNIDKIRALKPDLIIANKEENQQEHIEALAQEFPVWISDIHILAEALDMIIQVGKLTGTEAKAKEIATTIRSDFEALTPSSKPLKAAYFIWKHPYMLAAKHTFIDDMLKYCGFENVLTETRYPEITLEALQELQPQVILLSTEPYPFKQKHIEELQKYFPKAFITLVDGEMFSWYGSRLLKAPAYFSNLYKNLTINLPIK
ncbi:ABC transporter substrate-binding protein [Pedobacter glucosidilyticus]|uniref:ABC transporter substrate-binding protein n=1 Tax=Pedobacter glucosidilyticus TaxID=1122941 RepID=UPI0026EA6A12|nr:helical backbone metal receptor [Pedobacter glucosidilyticus]